VLPNTSEGSGVFAVSSNENSVSDYYFSISVESSMQAGDYLKIVFPSEFSSLSFTSSTCEINSVIFSCSEAETNTISITLSVTLPSNSRYQVKVPKITNPGATTTGYFSVFVQSGSSGQVLDSNDAFAVIRIAPSPEEATGTVSLSSNVVGQFSELTVKFLLESQIDTDGILQLELPEDFSFQNENCQVLDYSDSVGKISGNFECFLKFGILHVSGFGNVFSTGQGIAFKFYVKNPPFVKNAADGQFVIRTLVQGGSRSFDIVSLDIPEIVAGSFSSVKVQTLESFNKIVSGGNVYLKVLFTTENSVEDGGEITVDYKNSIVSGTCVVYSGVSSNSDGEDPICSISGDVATISNFGKIEAGSDIIIINQVTVDTSADIEIKSYSSGSKIIDSSSSGASITIDTSLGLITTTSVDVTIDTNRKGLFTINLNDGQNHLTGQIISVSIPSSISYTGTLSCSTSPSAISSCAYSSGTISMTLTSSFDCSSSCSITIDTSTTGNIKFPSMGSSKIDIFQIAVKIDTYFDNIVLDIEESSFISSTIQIFTEPAAFSPVILTLKLTNALEVAKGPYILITFNSFDDYLGTGLTSDTSINFLTSLSPKTDTGTVTCTLSTSSILIKNFNSIAANTEFTVSFLIKTPAAGTYNINIEAGHSYLNSITSITDTILISKTFTSSSVAWTSLTSSDRSLKIINSETSLSFSVQPSTSSSTNDYLFITIPSGWDISSSSMQLSSTSLTLSIYSTSYTQGLLVSLGSKTLPSTSPSTLLLTLNNGAFSGAGSGNMKFSLILSTWSIQNMGTVKDSSAADISFAGATSASLAYADYELSNTHRSSGDVLYKFFLTFNHSVPLGGSVEITFGSGVDLTYSYCTFSSVFSSGTTCSASGSKLSITGFNALASLTASYVKVFDLINPDADTTDSVTIRSLYVAGSSKYIDEVVLDGTALIEKGSTFNTTIEEYLFYPKSAGSFAYMSLLFYMDSSVPHSGQLTLTFPSEVTLPSISDNNCLFNLKFSSCSSSGNVITIEPVSTFPAGISMELIISGISVPVNTTSPLDIVSSYAGLTLSETANDGTSGIFISSKSVEQSLTGSLTVTPTNKAERARYDFTISSSISSSDLLLIWFPSTFPTNLGNIYCKSTASSRIDQKVPCDFLQFNLIQASGLSKSSFSFSIYDVNNPNNEGIIENIRVQVVDSSGVVLYSGSYSFTVTGLPDGIDLKSISLGNYDINEETQYSFITDFDTLPSVVWIDLPYEFNNEVSGAGEVYECSLWVVDDTFMNDQQVSSTVTCSNQVKNRINLAVSSPSGASSYLKIVVSGLKSTAIVGSSHFFRVLLLDNANQVLSKTYDFDVKSRVDYEINKQTLVVSSSSSTFTLAPGVSQTFSIYTSSSKVLAKENILISYSLTSLSPTSGIEITPAKLTLAKGTSSVPFKISVKSTVEPGEFVIKWKSASSRYTQPRYSLLTVSDTKTYTISVKNIPEMVVGRSTIPIKLNLLAAPEEALTISPTAPTGFVFSDIKFSAGSMSTSYTITVDSTVTAGSYSIDFEIEGQNSEYFGLDHSSVNVIVNDHDIESPSIVSFVVNSPRHKTSIDMTLQASEPCMFYYFTGPRGTGVPSNSSLINNAGKVDGYSLGYVDATYTYRFQVSGLQGEYDYVLYGLLGDTSGNFMTEVFAINLFTQDMDDSILFSLEFEKPYPSVADMKGKVLNALLYQFVVDSSRLSFESSTTSAATYKLIGTVMSDDPSPINIVKYTAIKDEINALLTGIKISESFNIDDSIEIIDNQRPQWLIYPEINSTTKDSVLVGFSLSEKGTVYAQIIADNATVPSSRQIVAGVDAYDEYALLTYKQKVDAEEYLVLTFDGLMPTSSYTLVMTAENNKDPDRYMNDELVAVIDFITQAGTVDSNNTDTSSWACNLMVPLLLNLLVS
jgi:hypothetical protein